MKIGIGIDTGGTYTDAVVYNFTSKEILGTSKALTTKHDLSVGILEALDALPAESLKQAEVISLSTTLATNACVEDKGGSAKLIFLGGDANVIDRNGKNYGLPPSADMYIQESFTKFTGEIDRDVDWDAFRAALATDFVGLDGVGIIEANAMRNSAVVEKKAKEIFAAAHDIPVVCSHELFNELNCLQRGASALLNARLVPVIRDFLRAIKQAMAARGINAQVVIVRSDGGLMSEEFAHVRPVETLLCGPAASVLGSAHLTNTPDNIVVDMGGTTTDIAFIKDGVPVSVVDGVRIGKWKTFVNGLYIKTFGLGGDTAVHYNDNGIFLEDYRVVPLCVAAATHPQIVENLKNIGAHKHSMFLHEHYMLVRDISNSPRYTAEEKTFCAALANGPLILRQACAAVPGRDMYTMDTSRLLKEGVVQLCGLTPTDIMHIKGDFAKFPAEASRLAAEYVAGNLGISVEELCDRVYDLVKRKLYVNIVKALLEINDPYYMKNGISPDVERFINDSYDSSSLRAKRSNPDFVQSLDCFGENALAMTDGALSLTFTTPYTLTGVGAPIHIFLSDVAQKLGTKAITPKHCEVANALGAIVGNIHATNIVDIRAAYDPNGITGYTVYGNTATREFATLEEAEAFAIDEARTAAHSEALRRGATGEIAVDCKLTHNEADTKNGPLYLGTRAVAHAVGGLAGIHHPHRHGISHIIKPV